MHKNFTDSVTGSRGEDVGLADGVTHFSIEDQTYELPNDLENGEKFNVGCGWGIEGMERLFGGTNPVGDHDGGTLREEASNPPRFARIEPDPLTLRADVQVTTFDRQQLKFTPAIRTTHATPWAAWSDMQLGDPSR